MRDGKLPHPTMADTIPMRVTEASPGYVKFSARATAATSIHSAESTAVRGDGSRFGDRMRRPHDARSRRGNRHDRPACEDAEARAALDRT